MQNTPLYMQNAPSKYPPAKPEALKTVSRSKRLRGRYRGPAKPLWSDRTACRGTHYRSFRSLPDYDKHPSRSYSFAHAKERKRIMELTVNLCYSLRHLSGSPFGVCRTRSTSGWTLG